MHSSDYFFQTSIIQTNKWHQQQNEMFGTDREDLASFSLAQTQLCCSTHKVIFFTNVAPLRRNKKANGITFIGQKQISLVSVLVL